MTNRRDFLSLVPAGLAIAGTGFLAAAPAHAQASPNIFSEFVTPETDPEFGQGGNNVATGVARHDEVVKGVYLLFQAPRSTDQLAVAKYFRDISEKNSDGELYNEEWHHDRSNPMIVSLFSATFTAPSVLADGDEVAWCSAFVNFVLMLTGRKGSWSALSGSFRKGPFPATEQPKVGDLVVFQDKGPAGAQGHGHVAFLEEPYDPTTGKVSVIGGNQGGHGGKVSSTVFDIQNGSKLLHSFRSVT